MRSPNDVVGLSQNKAQSLDRLETRQRREKGQKGQKTLEKGHRKGTDENRKRNKVKHQDKKDRTLDVKQVKTKEKQKPGKTKKDEQEHQDFVDAKPEVAVVANVHPSKDDDVISQEPHYERAEAFKLKSDVMNRDSAQLADPDDDPYALYARPSKVRRDVEELTSRLRPTSMDAPTLNPAPPIIIPGTPVSHLGPPLPPHPVPSTTATPDVRRRNKSGSVLGSVDHAGVNTVNVIQQRRA